LDADLDALYQAQKHFQRAYRGLKRRLERGMPASKALSSMDLPALRDELAREMVRIEAARQRLRTSLISLCLEEGMTASEVAQLWGFSRQLAQRYAKQGAAEVSADGSNSST
jgi:predicted transcriptional regulator